MIPAEVLLGAYARGVFPMAEDGEILWFSPENRGIIPLDERFHINKGLKRALESKSAHIPTYRCIYQVKVDGERYQAITRIVVSERPQIIRTSIR